MTETGLELLVGHGIEPFRLGSTVWETIALLRTRNLTCSVSWDNLASATNPILIALDKPKVTLLFEGSSQRLCLIELDKPEQWLSYRNKTLVDPETGRISSKTIHHIFGPTYQATPHPSSSTSSSSSSSSSSSKSKTTSQGEHVLIYPGVAFSLLPSANPEIEEASVQRVYVANTTDQGLDDAKAFFNLAVTLPVLFPPEAMTRASIFLDPKEATRVEFCYGTGQKVTVTLGKTHHEDLICDFGAPLRQFIKEDDRLTIHERLSQVPAPHSTDNGAHQRGEQGQPYFLNYFQYGVDFLLDGTTHKVIKMVLHSNIAGQVLFGKYDRCRWSLSLQGSQSERPVTSDDRVETVDKYFSRGSDDKNKAARPLFKLDRTVDGEEPHLIGKPTDLIELSSRCVVERTEGGQIETMWLF